MGIGWNEAAKIFQMTGINHDVLKINRRFRRIDGRATLIRKREREKERLVDLFQKHSDAARFSEVFRWMRSVLSNSAYTLPLPALPLANRRSAGERFKRSQLRPSLCASTSATTPK